MGTYESLRDLSFADSTRLIFGVSPTSLKKMIKEDDINDFKEFASQIYEN